MEGEKVLIGTIKQIRVSGKWIEFFFEEGVPYDGEFKKNEESGYDFSSKWGYVFREEMTDELWTDIFNNGIKGIKVAISFKHHPQGEIKTLFKAIK